MITFTVAGTLPAPQGSKRHVGHGVLIESSPNVKPWRQAVSAAALDARRRHGIHEPLRSPCTLSVVFLFPRPKGHYGTRGIRPSAPRWKTTRPDLDKLIRSTADALTSVLLFDDSQMVSICASKRYCLPDEIPGCLVTLIPHVDGQKDAA